MGSVRYRLWHEGNFTPSSYVPLSGGTMGGQLLVAEGSAAVPGLSFANDGVPDTGLFHIADGVFGISCNTAEQARFSTNGLRLSNGLTMYGTGTYSPVIAFNANGYAPFMRSNSVASTLEFVNSANSAVNLVITESGTLAARNGVTSNGLDSGGANFRAANGNYGVMLRNDGANVYLVQTASGDQWGTFNRFRPFSWGLSAGYVP